MLVADGNPTNSMLTNLKEGTQLMTIYQPYFYVIQDTRNGMYYAGAKWAHDANPNNFMKLGGYNTSSDVIKTIIEQHGFDVFVVRKIRVFKTAEQAQSYETRFLRKINARKHPNFYNGHNNDGAMDIVKIKTLMLELYGVDNAAKSFEVQEKMKNTRLERYGVKYSLQSGEIRNKMELTNLKRYGSSNYSNTEDFKRKYKNTIQTRYNSDHYFQTENFKITYKENMISKYGVDNSFKSEEVKARIREKNIKNLGVEYPTQSKLIIEKMKSNNKKKYGVENISQIPEVKEKKKQKKLEKQNREIVKTLKKYQLKYKFRISKSWTIKSDEYLEEILAQTIEKFGPIDKNC
jgi:hypothetical protein